MDSSPFLTLNNSPKYIVHMSKDDICLYTITIQMICFSPWELDRINCWYNNLSQKKYFSVQWGAKIKSIDQSITKWGTYSSLQKKGPTQRNRCKRKIHFYKGSGIPDFLIIWLLRSWRIGFVWFNYSRDWIGEASDDNHKWWKAKQNLLFLPTGILLIACV